MYEVWLDGERVATAIRADVAGGWVDVMHPSCDRQDRGAARHYGNVEIRLSN